LCRVPDNRHTCATNLLHAGVETTVIDLWRGHESVAPQIYVHADLALRERDGVSCALTIMAVARSFRWPRAESDVRRTRAVASSATVTALLLARAILLVSLKKNTPRA
jgi:hypothetical protein